MAVIIPCTDLCSNSGILKNSSISLLGFSPSPSQEPRSRPAQCLLKERTYSQSIVARRASSLSMSWISISSTSKKLLSTIPRCSSDSSNAAGDNNESPAKVPFGYSRKDVILIGVGVTLAGIGLKSGLEYFGVDPLQAGNVVQLVLVLGLTIGWISTYIFRVSNKEMTYAQQLRDYEDKVMEKRLESLTEGEIEALLEQVDEEKRRLASGEQVK